MNKYIREELQKCEVAVIPNYDNNTTQLHIPKGGKTKLDFVVGNSYIIEVDISLLQPCDWYNTIHNNWNKGIAPNDNLLNAQVLNINGKMLYLYTLGVNTKTYWTGWLPKGNVKIIQELR